MRDAKRKSFLKWGSHSLIGHVVLFQLFWSVPMVILFWESNYSNGTLMIGRVLSGVFVASLCGLAVAILGWYTVSLPLIKRRKKGR